MYKWPTDPVTSRWLEPNHYHQHSLMKPSMLKMLNLESVENSGIMMIPNSYFHDNVTRLGLKLQEAIQSEDSLTDTINEIESHRGWSFQTILNYQFNNLDGQFQHHPDYLLDAQGLLGMELLDLNCFHMVLINGDDELAEWLMDFLTDSSLSIKNPSTLVKFLSKPCRNGNTPLHFASFFGMADVVRKLLELGVNPNARNQLQCKPVDCADSDETRNLFRNLYENPLLEAMVLDLTLDLVLNPSTHTSNKVVPMEYSIHQPDSIKRPPGPSIGYPIKNLTVTSTPESMVSDTSSIESNDVKIPLKSCMKNPTHRGESLATTTTSDDRRVKFDTPSLLIHACQMGDVGLAQSLLAPYTSLPHSRHSLLSYRSPRHQSSLLHLTCHHRQSNMTQLLLNLNCDINATDSDGQTPLHIACSRGDLPTIQILCDHPQLRWDTKDRHHRAPEDLTRSTLILNLLHRAYLRHHAASPSSISGSSPPSTASSPSPRWSSPPLPTTPPRYCTKTLPRRPHPHPSPSSSHLPYYPPPTYSSATVRYRHHHHPLTTPSPLT